MRNLSRHIAAARFEAPSLKQAKKSMGISFEDITLNNTDLLFSIGATLNLTFLAPNIRPPKDINRFSGTFIRAALTSDIDLIKTLSAATDIREFSKIIHSNTHKVQQINIPYDAHLPKREINFKPISLHNGENPENLCMFGMVLQKNNKTNKEMLLSDILMQVIISDNIVLRSKNLVDLRNLKFDSYLDFEIINQVENNNEAYFSDQFVSLDPSGYLKFIFFWDKIQFLKEKSVFANILKNGSLAQTQEKIIADSRIGNIEIIRKRVKKSIDGFSSFDANQANDIIIYSSDDKSGDLIPNESKDIRTGATKAQISSNKIIKNSSNYISFSVNDHFCKKIKMGMYQYHVRVQVEDGMLKFLIDSLNILREVQNVFERYEGVYDSPSLSLKKRKNLGILNILRILFSLKTFSDTQIERMQQEFLALCRTPQGLSRVMDFNRSLMIKISYALGKRGVTSTDNKGKIYSKDTSKLFFLEDSQKFPEIVDVSKLINIESEYFDINSRPSTGASTFSVNDIEKRFLQEFKKNMAFEGDYGDINFATLNKNLSNDMGGTNESDKITENLFNFGTTFFSYLSPASSIIFGTEINNQKNPSAYVPTTSPAMVSLSQELTKLGVRILTPREVGASRAKKEETLCSESVVGDISLNIEKTYDSQSYVPAYTDLKDFHDTMRDSQNLTSGIIKYYNNFNLKISDYDLDSPNNLLSGTKSRAINKNIEEMPNQIRSLFASKSDGVRDKWASMENDFFENPSSIKMMQENYSNLIRVEVLSGFERDLYGFESVKMPIFKRLEMSDMQGLLSGESLFCRTFIVDNKVIGVGQKNVKDNSIKMYYNKHFIITRGD